MYKGWGNDIYSMDFEDIHANVERNTVLLIELGDLEIAEALRRRLPGSKILLVIRHIDPNYLSQTLIGRGVSKRDADRRLATLKSDLEAMDQCSEFCDLTLFNEGNSHDLSRLVGRIHEFLGTSSGDDN
jgi:hypothetical protein